MSRSLSTFVISEEDMIAERREINRGLSKQTKTRLPFMLLGFNTHSVARVYGRDWDQLIPVQTRKQYIANAGSPPRVNMKSIKLN